MEGVHLMSDRVILKRGTSTQNDSYVGTIGELTYDTNSATIRMFDGVTTGGTKLLKPVDLTSNLANYTNTALLQANLANYTNTGLLQANLSNYPNTSQVSANLANYTNTALLQANLANYTNTGLLQANLSNYTNTGLLQTNYPNTSQLSANLANYQTLAGLSSNVVLLTSNNSSYLGGVAANQYSTTGKAIAMAMVFGG